MRSWEGWALKQNPEGPAGQGRPGWGAVGFEALPQVNSEAGLQIVTAGNVSYLLSWKFLASLESFPVDSTK